MEILVSFLSNICLATVSRVIFLSHVLRETKHFPLVSVISHVIVPYDIENAKINQRKAIRFEDMHRRVDPPFFCVERGV